MKGHKHFGSAGERLDWRSALEGLEQRLVERVRELEAQGPRHSGRVRGRSHGQGMEPWADLDAEAQEGEQNMFGNERDWRGRGHHGRGRHEIGFEHGRGRGGRPFEQGDLRWLVLDLIAAQPRHGYEIIKAIEEMLDGQYSPSPGVIYPTLTFLEETGLIASEAQENKRLYSITEQGRATLEQDATSVRVVRERIEAARARFGGRPAPEMMRAMDNLRMAIQVRLAKGALSSESLATITAAIDRAASEIERS